MAIRVNRTGAGTRYREGAFDAASRYRENAIDPATDWSGPTAAAETLWELGVSEAAAAHRFSSGVLATGNAGYKASISDQAQTRYRTGTAAAEPKYVAAMTPFFDALEGATLSPRTDDPYTNIRRVEEVVHVLRRAAGLE